jgi:two-component system phosphate regulon response regulator PhoB
MLNDKTILIIDQDPLMREILSDALCLVHANSLEADGIREALELLANETVDAVICEDRLLPGTGLELLRRIKDCGLDLPFALMTGSELEIENETAFQAGVDIIFEKPFGLDDFLEGMRILCASNELKRLRDSHLSPLGSFSR